MPLLLSCLTAAFLPTAFAVPATVNGKRIDSRRRELAGDVSLLSINTATLRKQLALPAIIEACARRGIGALCPWRDQVQAARLARPLPRLHRRLQQNPARRRL